MTTSPKLGHVTIIYDFISTSITAITTKLQKKGAMRCADLILPLIISLLQLHHETSIYGFIFTSVSPITTKLSRMIDFHTLMMPYRNNYCFTFMALSSLLKSPIRSKLRRMVDQKKLILPFKNDDITTTSSRG